ncbi:MAG: hypothetical protein HW421_4150, partial [Ignavibacteria bacterium]|nr:hypothetical protein [Ignavibacteria bacterium]
ALCHGPNASQGAKDAITAYRADNTKKAGCCPVAYYFN